MADWDARQYLRFADERTRPARDLLAQVTTEAPRLVVDLGCGPGNSTELLAARWPDAEIVGVDSSPDMLAKARKALPSVRFDQGDVAEWSPASGCGVVFANAVFQWVPDQLHHLTRILEALAPGSTLAVQMPDNLAEPTHVLMREVAAAGPWAGRLAPVAAGRPILPPVAAYYEALAPLSVRLDLWHTIYNHALDGAPAILEWVKGTGLRPFIDPLADDQRNAYLTAYLARLEQAYPRQSDGRSLLRFPRFFLIAERR